MSELEEAIDRVVAGPERKTRLICEREKRTIAYHEAGHALVAHALPNADPVHKITIVSRGRALGYTMTLPTEDKFLVTRQEFIDELAMLLGGRVAEEMVIGDITTGAQNDLERATKIARQMVTEYGMSDALGPADPRAEAARGVPRPRLRVAARLLRRRSRSRSTPRSGASSTRPTTRPSTSSKKHRGKLDQIAARAHREGDDREGGARRAPRGHRQAAPAATAPRRAPAWRSPGAVGAQRPDASDGGGTLAS